MSGKVRKRANLVRFSALLVSRQPDAVSPSPSLACSSLVRRTAQSGASAMQLECLRSARQVEGTRGGDTASAGSALCRETPARAHDAAGTDNCSDAIRDALALQPTLRFATTLRPRRRGGARGDGAVRVVRLRPRLDVAQRDPARWRWASSRCARSSRWRARPVRVALPLPGAQRPPLLTTRRSAAAGARAAHPPAGRPGAAAARAVASQAARRAADRRAARARRHALALAQPRDAAAARLHRRRRRAAAAAPAAGGVRRARARVRRLPRHSTRRDAPRLLRRRAAAEQERDACTAVAGDTEAAMPARSPRSISRWPNAARRAAQRRRGGRRGWCVPAARRGTTSPAARRAVTRQREPRRARGDREQEAARWRAIPRAPRPRTCRISARHGRRRLRRRRAPPPAASAARPRPPTAATTAPPPTAPPPPPPPPKRARRASAPRPAPPTDLEAAAAAIAAAAEATALEEDAAASIAAAEAAADDGGDDLEPSAPLVPAETPGVDRTAAGGADPTSYAEAQQSARGDSAAGRGVQVRLVRGPAAARARVERRQRSQLGVVATNPRGGGGGAEPGAPPSQVPPFRVLPRRAPPRRARHRPPPTRLGLASGRVDDT